MLINERVKQLNQSNSDKKSYSTDEIIHILGVTRQTVYKLIKRGCFKAVCVESGYRIYKDSFDKWLDGDDGGDC